MTLPTQYLLPIPPALNNVENVGKYVEKLHVELQDMYQQLAQEINGNYRSDVFQGSSQWEPVLKGTTTAGTFTYGTRTGIVLRQTLLSELWFDISWTATGGAAGNLYLELPYIVSNYSDKPFSNCIQYSNITLTAGYTTVSINAIPNTYRGEIWESGSGNATQNLGIPAAGSIIGTLRYIGTEE